MGHSIRSKIKKRLRTAKRQRVDAMIVTPQLKEHHEALMRVAQGRTIVTRKPKNAFLHPNAADAVFPQHEIAKPIDFRAQHLPMAGYAFRGNRRKYEGEQAELMQQVATATHPKMERLAGGGAILASSKQRVTTKEAELIAAAVQCSPNGEQLSAASAVAAAVAQASAAGVDTSDKAAAPTAAPAAAQAPAQPAPEGDADTSRRPVLKDARRQQRAAEHRPRPNSVKKKKGKRSVAAASAAAEPAEPEAPKAPPKAAAPAAKGVAGAKAEVAPAKPAASVGTPGAAAPDGDAEMKPAEGSGPAKKVKRKGKRSAKKAA